MKNKYLINRNFYIKDDLNALLLYFDYISNGFNLAKYFNYSFTKKLVHILLRLSIIIIYYLRIYKFKYKIVSLNDDALVIIKGSGKWGSTVKLIKSKDKLKITKKIFDKRLYLKEKKFYEKYKKNSSKIKLPNCLFLKENTIEIEFLGCKSFQRLVNEGSINFDSAMNHYNRIKQELKEFYQKEHTLIHADTDLTNIFIKDDKYYLIDFTESHENSYKYDFYNTLYAILYSFGYINIDEKTISNFKNKKFNILKLLDTTEKELTEIEAQFIASRNKRFPGIYYK